MNANLIMENYLLVLKSTVEVFVHGTLESSNPDVRELLKNKSIVICFFMFKKNYFTHIKSRRYFMTQKELDYVEDAVKHESNLASILEESIESLEDEELVKFMKKQVKDHKSLHKKLMNLLEEKENEW